MKTTSEKLWNFMKRNGVRLDAYGSSELGFRLDVALEVASMIHALDMDVLGMEVWRSDDDGYSIDSLAGWYPEGLGRSEDFHDAMKFLARLELARDDVITVQF
jgi:hypothetical protein